MNYMFEVEFTFGGTAKVFIGNLCKRWHQPYDCPHRKKSRKGTLKSSAGLYCRYAQISILFLQANAPRQSPILPPTSMFCFQVGNSFKVIMGLTRRESPSLSKGGTFQERKFNQFIVAHGKVVLNSTDCPSLQLELEAPE